MTARIYQKCLEVALNDQTINETIQNRERIEMPLVKIRKTLIGHWPTNKVMEGFHITRVRIILDYRSNENASYNEDIIVDVEHRIRASDKQEKAVVIGSMLGSVSPQ